MGGDADCHEESKKHTKKDPPSGVALEDPTSGVALHPGRNDVRFGRGGRTNYHVGNHRFRTMADSYRQGYRQASRKEKSVIVQQLVDSWKNLDPPGRFLALTDPLDEDASLWHDVGTEMALKKARKLLGEGGRAIRDRRKAMTDPSGEDSLRPKDNTRGDKGHHQEQSRIQQGQGDNDGDFDFMGMEGLDAGLGESFPTAASLTSVFNN